MQQKQRAHDRPLLPRSEGSITHKGTHGGHPKGTGTSQATRLGPTPLPAVGLNRGPDGQEVNT